MPRFWMRGACSALLLLIAACDSGGSATGGDASGDTTRRDTGSAADAVPSFDIPDEQKNLVNGVVGKAGHIIDGDTLDVWIGRFAPKKYEVRLRGINAPECDKERLRTPTGDLRWVCTADDEYYGLAAHQRLKTLLEGKEFVVTCDSPGADGWCPTDDFDRYLVYLAVDGADVSTSLAWHGAAMSFTAFTSSKRAAICEAEYDAQDHDRGMWAAGSVSQVINMMSSHTTSWYRDHDERCDEALGR